MPSVYILRCGDGSLYTGAAKHLPRRLAQHAAGRASRYTRSRLPVLLVWSRRVRSWSHALRTERRIKALRRPEKDALVAGGRLPLARRRRVCDVSSRRLLMGRVTGDKSRYNKKRRQKLARRVEMRALAKDLTGTANAAAAAPAKPTAPRT